MIIWHHFFVNSLKTLLLDSWKLSPDLSQQEPTVPLGTNESGDEANCIHLTPNQPQSFQLTFVQCLAIRRWLCNLKQPSCSDQHILVLFIILRTVNLLLKCDHHPVEDDLCCHQHPHFSSSVFSKTRNNFTLILKLSLSSHLSRRYHLSFSSTSFFFFCRMRSPSLSFAHKVEASPFPRTRFLSPPVTDRLATSPSPSPSPSSPSPSTFSSKTFRQ